MIHGESRMRGAFHFLQKGRGRVSPRGEAEPLLSVITCPLDRVQDRHKDVASSRGGRFVGIDEGR